MLLPVSLTTGWMLCPIGAVTKKRSQFAISRKMCGLYNVTCTKKCVHPSPRRRIIPGRTCTLYGRLPSLRLLSRKLFLIILIFKVSSHLRSSHRSLCPWLGPQVQRCSKYVDVAHWHRNCPGIWPPSERDRRRSRTWSLASQGLASYQFYAVES